MEVVSTDRTFGRLTMRKKRTTGQEERQLEDEVALQSTTDSSIQVPEGLRRQPHYDEDPGEVSHT